MRAGAGKQKGSSFERHVCKELSLWVSVGRHDDIFWRSSLSGGRATIGLRFGSIRGAQAGDISAISSLGERLLDYVVVECKHYRELDVFSGIVNDTGRLHKFWHDLRQHSARFGKAPMLIARQNNMPTVCLLSSATSFLLFGLSNDHVSALIPRWDCHVVIFDCFLREARVPELGVTVPARRRAVLA